MPPEDHEVPAPVWELVVFVLVAATIGALVFARPLAAVAAGTLCGALAGYLVFAPPAIDVDSIVIAAVALPPLVLTAVALVSRGLSQYTAPRQ